MLLSLFSNKKRNCSNMVKEERVRTEILEAAQRMFQRYGYRKTTIEDIAGEAGKGKSSLYYYYKNKEEIFLAVLWNEWNAVMEQIRVAVDPETPVDEQLQTYINVKVKGIANFINIYRGLRSDALLKYEFIRRFRLEIRDHEIRILQELLRRGAEAGDLRYRQEDDLRLIAFTLATILQGIQETIIRGSEELPFEQPEILEMVGAVVLHGICSR